MKPTKTPLTFQELILRLEQFWADQGCLLAQPYDMEMGAGTFHPYTFFKALGPQRWKRDRILDPSPVFLR